MWLSSEQLRQQRQQRQQQPRRSARLRDSAARSRPGPRFTLATSSGSSSSLTRPRRTLATATATSPGKSTSASASSAGSRPDPTNESQDADVVFLAEVSSEPRCASGGGRPAVDLIDLVSSDSENSDGADSCSDETRFEEEPGYLHRQQQQWTGSNHLQDQPDDDDEASLTYFTEVTSFSDSGEDDDDDDTRTDTGAGDGSSSSLPLCQSQWRAGMHDADDLTPVRQEGDSGSTATPANPWTRSPLPPRWRDMALRLDDIGVATTSFKGFKALEGFSCASTPSSSRADDHQALDNHLHRDGHQDGDDQDKQSQSSQDRLQDGDDQDEKTQSQDRLLAEKEDDCAEIQCGQLLVWDDEVMDVDEDDHASEAPDDAGYASQDGRMCRPWSQGGGWGWSPGRGGGGIECS